MMSTVTLFSSRLWKGNRRGTKNHFFVPGKPSPNTTSHPSPPSPLPPPALLLIPLCYESAQRPNPLSPLSIWLQSILLHTLSTWASVSGVPPWHLTHPMSSSFPRSGKWVSSPSAFLTVPFFFPPNTIGHWASFRSAGPLQPLTRLEMNALLTWHTLCENPPLLPSPAYLLRTIVHRV